MAVLTSPDHAVVGATDLAASARFFEALGFAPGARGLLPAPTASALYGLPGETEELWLAVPGAPLGRVRLVATPHAAPPAGPFDRGPHALDLYTRDIERSLREAEAAGATIHEIGRYSVGPLALQEAKAVGPDGVAVVFLQLERRRPSALDRDPSRLNSELHSSVFVVASVSEALPFWRDAAGLGLLLDATIREPAVARFMGLPRPDTPIRLAVLADTEQRPSRFEILEFPEDEGPRRPEWPLAGGFFGVGFRVPSLEAARRALPALALGGSTAGPAGGEPRGRGAGGLAPGGVRVELWEPA